MLATREARRGAAHGKRFEISSFFLSMYTDRASDGEKEERANQQEKEEKDEKDSSRMKRSDKRGRHTERK